MAAEAMLDGWPVAATLALVVAGERVRTGRRRSALNGALHELRRPLQILALTAPSHVGGPGDGASPLELTWLALGDLDRQINGGNGPFEPRLVSLGEMAEGAAERWRPAAVLGGGSIRVHALAGGLVHGDPGRIAQAVDNLVANALEHGGPEVEIEAAVCGQRARLSVYGRPATGSLSASAKVDVAALRARLAGRARRGHGLRIVSDVAALHGGRLLVGDSGDRTTAVLELPVAGAMPAAA
jgi:signal transduction histidine kinase